MKKKSSQARSRSQSTTSGPIMEFRQCPMFVVADAPQSIVMTAQDPFYTGADPNLEFRISRFKNLESVLHIGELDVQYDQLFRNKTPRDDTGSIYIARHHWERARLDARVVWPPLDTGYDYEFRRLVTWSPPTAGRPSASVGERFNGYHGSLSARADGDIEASIYPPGRSRTEKPQSYTIAASKLSVYVLTTHSVAVGAGEGALYLSSTCQKELGLSIPKLPPNFD